MGWGFVDTNLNELTNRINQCAGAKQQLCKELATLQTTTKNDRHKLDRVVVPVRDLLKTTVGHASEAGGKALASFMTQGFRDVLGDGYGITFEDRGQSAKAKSVAVIEHRPNGTAGDILRTSGGSSLDLAALIAQLVTICSWRGKIAQVLIVDESFSGINHEIMPSVIEFLKQICQAVGMQVILVSHNAADGDFADNAIRLRSEKGKAVVTCEIHDNG